MPTWNECLGRKGSDSRIPLAIGPLAFVALTHPPLLQLAWTCPCFIHQLGPSACHHARDFLVPDRVQVSVVISPLPPHPPRWLGHTQLVLVSIPLLPTRHPRNPSNTVTSPKEAGLSFQLAVSLAPINLCSNILLFSLACVLTDLTESVPSQPHSCFQKHALGIHEASLCFPSPSTIFLMLLLLTSTTTTIIII